MIRLTNDLRKKIKGYCKAKGKDVKAQKNTEFIPEEEKHGINDIKTKVELQKLTEEQKQKVIYVFNDFASLYFSDENPNSKYITEYDILMKQKEEEFKNYLLEDNEPHQIESLLEMCDEYIEEKNNPDKKFFGTEFGLIMMYDMWLNKSSMWPVGHNPEWKEWEKLKKKKVKRSNLIPISSLQTY
jgi:hypothetical protein